MALTQFEKNRIAQADRAAIVNAIAAIKRRGQPLWLSTANAFPNGTPPQSWNSVRRNLASVRELVAVSAPNHCVDGWGFLARSLAAMAAGDAHAARHFSYYAQLRASLAIMASTGIGVFNDFNCAVNRSGQTIRIDDRQRHRALGTHAMAWLALEEWAKAPISGTLISRAFTIRKITFDECLSAMWPGTSGRVAAYDLILSWGVDLQQAFSDRQARNISSYVAQVLNPVATTAEGTLDFLVDFWGDFEPQFGDPYLTLDKHLLRLLIETQHRTVNSPDTLSKDIASRYPRLDPAVQAVISEDFLARRTSPNNAAVIRNGQVYINPASPMQMISRGALLLRAATAIVSQLLFDAAVTVTPDLDFWLLPFGSNLGFWDRSGPPTPMSELWADVDLALKDALALRNGCQTPPFDRFDWSSADKNGLPRIFEAERIILWGLCP